MAQRRMFSLKVVDTDNFLDMSPTAQNLYFHLGMRADDDGFVSNPKKIMKFVGAPDDDMKVLIVKGFIIPMATNGVCVITHWKTNNLIKSDRYTETIYLEEKSRLDEKNGVYGYFSDSIVPKIGNGSIMVPEVEPQVRLGKDNIYILVFNHWNKQGIINHAVLTDKMKRSINGRLEEKHTPEDIMAAISNYALILKSDDYYFKYKWTLQDFLQRGFDKFLDLKIAKQNYYKSGLEKKDSTARMVDRLLQQ